MSDADLIEEMIRTASPDADGVVTIVLEPRTYVIDRPIELRDSLLAALRGKL